MLSRIFRNGMEEKNNPGTYQYAYTMSRKVRKKTKQIGMLHDLSEEMRNIKHLCVTEYLCTQRQCAPKTSRRIWTGKTISHKCWNAHDSRTSSNPPDHIHAQIQSETYRLRHHRLPCGLFANKLTRDAISMCLPTLPEYLNIRAPSSMHCTTLARFTLL